MRSLSLSPRGVDPGRFAGAWWRRSHTALCLLAGVVLAVGFALSPHAMAAQQQQGSINGRAKPASGEVVVITNVSTGLTRQVNVGSDGSFKFAAVPPGTYVVALKQNGSAVATQSGIVVNANVGTTVSFLKQQATNLSSMTVNANSISPIDVSSTSSSLVLNSQEVNSLPVGRSAISVSLLSPTVVQNPAFGIPSFGGASSAENAFYVNGMNVTDDNTFLHFAQPPFEALQSFQVKTGGIGASYGNALGGVLNMTTKSGTNTFHAGVDVYWTPRFLTEASPNVAVQGQAVQHNADNHSMNLVYNVWGSGPIIKNHLFFYGMLQGNRATSDTYGLNLSEATKTSSPYGLFRIDWNITSNNVLTITGWDAKNKVDGTEYNLIPQTGQLFSAQRGSINGGYKETTGNKALIGHYTFYASNHFNISALYGYVRFDRGSNSSNPACSLAFDHRNAAGQAIHVGCAVNALTFVTPNANDARHEWRIDGEWLSGDGAGLLSGHDVTFGYASSIFRTVGNRHYPGPTMNFTGQPLPGVAYNYYWVPQSGIVNSVCYSTGNAPPAGGACPNAPYAQGAASYVVARQFVDSGSYYTKKHSYYIEDNWQMTPDFLLNLGVRNDGFHNYNALNQVFVSQANEWSPRLGFSWDINGDGSAKLYGSYAEYFIPIANNTNVRAAGGEYDASTYYQFNGTINADGSPSTFGTELGAPYTQGSGAIPNPNIVATRNLKPESEKEIILGFQKQIGDTNWSYGIQAMRRWLVNGSDDICSFLWYPGFVPSIYQYAKSQGWDLNSVFPDGPYSALAGGTGCIISNPGKNIQTYADTNGNGKLNPITIPNSVLKMPTAQRTYNAVTISLHRAFADNWFFGMSYTWSHLYGNDEGYVLTSIGQTDAGISEAFDFPGLETGAYGDLANDHRHTFKFWGKYQFAPSWRVGFSAYIMSGKPLSCRGTYPNSSNLAYFYGAFTHWCGSTGGSSQSPAQGFPYGGHLIQQGTVARTPWIYNLNLQFAWTPVSVPGLEVMVNWFNVLGTQHYTQQSQAYDNGNYTPVQTYMQPTAFQEPTSIQLGLRYQFF